MVEGYIYLSPSGSSRTPRCTLPNKQEGQGKAMALELGRDYMSTSRLLYLIKEPLPTAKNYDSLARADIRHDVATLTEITVSGTIITKLYTLPP